MRVHLQGNAPPGAQGAAGLRSPPAQSRGSRDSASISLGLVSYVLAYSSPPAFKLAKAEEADRVGRSPRDTKAPCSEHTCVWQPRQRNSEACGGLRAVCGGHMLTYPQRPSKLQTGADQEVLLAERGQGRKGQ